MRPFNHIQDWIIPVVWFIEYSCLQIDDVLENFPHFNQKSAEGGLTEDSSVLENVQSRQFLDNLNTFWFHASYWVSISRVSILCANKHFTKYPRQNNKLSKLEAKIQIETCLDGRVTAPSVSNLRVEKINDLQTLYLTIPKNSLHLFVFLFYSTETA